VHILVPNLFKDQTVNSSPKFYHYTGNH